MIKKTILFIAHLMVAGFFSVGYAQETNFITYNIRFDNPGDGENRWDARKESLVRLLREYNPDIFGIQEGLIHQVNYIDRIKDVLKGGTTIALDTTKLAVPKEEITND